MNRNWNHLKNVADGLGSDLDAEQAWDRFEKRREKKKRRFIFWWPYGIIGAVFFIGILVSVKPNNIHKNRTTSQINQKQKIVEMEDQAVHTATESFTTSEDLYIQNDTEENVLTPHSSFPTSPSKELSNSPDPEIINPNESDAGGLPHAKVFNQADQIASSAPIQPVPEINFQNPNPDLNKEATQVANNVSYLHVAASTHSISDSQNNIKENNSMESQSPIVRELIHIASITQNHYISQDQIKLQVEDYIQFSNSSASEYKATAKQFSFQTRYVYGFADRTIHGDDGAFIERRQIQEEVKESNAIELLLTRELSSLLSVSTGLSMAQYRSRLFEVNQEVIQNVSFENVLLERRIKGGVTEELRGEFIGSQTIITERVRFQKYLDFSIPVYLNLHLDVMPRLDVSVSMGASYSIINTANGVSFDSAVSQGSYQSLDALNYRNSGLMQGLMNVAIALNVSNDVDILFGGQLRRDLNNRITSSENMSDTYHSYGLLLGVQKRF